MLPLKELDHAAARLLSPPSFRAGVESADFSDFEHPARLGREADVDLEPLRDVLKEVPRRFGSNQKAECDAWLAPRLHFALRLNRREAARRGIWRWLGCVFAPEYVRWRWGADDVDPNDPVANAAKIERFIGPDYKQALARLWWMAELFRNGPDYAPVSAAVLNQDVPNNLFRMDIAHHRPTVQAAVVVLEGKSGREANALAKAVNSAATTLIVDLIAPDEPLDPEASLAWIGEAGEVDPGAHFDSLPPGPEDPKVSGESVETMIRLLSRLLEDAPVRGRKSRASAPEPVPVA